MIHPIRLWRNRQLAHDCFITGFWIMFHPGMPLTDISTGLGLSLGRTERAVQVLQFLKVAEAHMTYGKRLYFPTERK